MTLTPTVEAKVGHIEALDGVRGLALAAVVLHHIAIRNPEHPIAGAWLSVDLFYALSGCLITLSILRTGDGSAVGEFLRRRFWRIAPAMAVLLVVYVIASIGADDRSQRLDWAFAGTLQWANVQAAMHPPFSHHINHLWSLSAEVQFYVAWGIGLSWLLRRRASRATIVTILVALFVATTVERIVLWQHGTIWNRLYFAPDTHGGSLLLGCLVGLAFTWGWLRWRTTLGVLVIPSFLFMTWGAVELSFLEGRTYIWGFTAISASCAVLVAASAIQAPSPLRPLLESAPLRVLGRISYSVYLWHLPVIEEVTRRNPPHGLVGVAALAVPLSLAIGGVSYVLVERPLMSSAGRARLRARFAG